MAENSKDLSQNQFGFTLPIALKEHYEYLQSLSKNEDFDVNSSLKEDFKVPAHEPVRCRPSPL